jgi:hypothetical protein
MISVEYSDQQAGDEPHANYYLSDHPFARELQELPLNDHGKSRRAGEDTTGGAGSGAAALGLGMMVR